MNLDSCFKTLEIQYTTSIKEIKDAFKKCLLKYHPDKVNQSDTEALHKANQETARIIKAYNYLKKNISYENQFQKKGYKSRIYDFEEDS